MGQSSSRHAAPSRDSFQTTQRTLYEHTRLYAYSDDNIASTHDAPKKRRRAVSHRAETQSIKSTSRHQRTTSGDIAPVTSRTGQRATHSPKASSRQDHTTPDKRYYHDEPRSGSHRNDQGPRSPNFMSQLSLTGSRHRRSRSRKECVVCTESRSLSHFPYKPPTARCAHDVDVCSRCLRTWISTSFSSKTWDDVNCPTCAERLSYEDIREFAPSEIFRKYKKLHTKAELKAMKGFYWCITKGCKSGQTIAPGTSKFKCVRCKQTHCMEHNMLWHKGETCKQYESRSVQTYELKVKGY